MFRKALKKKRNVAALSVVAVLALAGMAFAFWTTTGSGSGSGSVATSNGTLTLHGTISSALTPGSSSAVPFTADNKGASDLQVGTVHAVVSIDAEHVTAGCKPSDFTIGDTVENQVIPAGKEGVALTHNGSIEMKNSSESQDGCKGATISLELSS
jgi:hypothetical protein